MDPVGVEIDDNPILAPISYADTRIFSPATGAGLCDTIGRYVYLFKRLTASYPVDFTDSNT